MTLATTKIQDAIIAFDFVSLFNGLGWDRYSDVVSVEAGGGRYTLRGVAQKIGRCIFVCEAATMPDHAMRLKIKRALSKVQAGQVIIFTDAGHTQQIWQYAPRVVGEQFTVRYRDVELFFYRGQSGAKLAGFASQLAFRLDEEDDLTGVVVDARLEALRVEKATKRFYDKFAARHQIFTGQIAGLDGLNDDGETRKWYASLMLNRLMFAYFIQRKRLLNNDAGYLRHKLDECLRNGTGNGFFTYYRSFLLPFFHEGLGRKADERTAEMRRLLGDVPYLNGGLFEKHVIERDHEATLDIPDEAFAGVFDLFDAYDWVLDSRPGRGDTEINPDILGYIFEKFINQKQMGAYYTKEDITEYISKNTIIPFLFDAAQPECKVAFAPDGPIWRLLRAEPDRYIFAAGRRGVDVPLPAAIAAGIADVQQRGGWNRPAPETLEDQPFALPTETWREHVARRQRCQEVRAKLAAGEVTQINDLITLNLDSITFARDVIQQCEGSDLLLALYHALTRVSVLDPTCGSGAFLFAALNILAPLYEAALDRMESFVAEDDARLEREGGRERHPEFRTILGEVAQHANRAYFILKSIIVRNLYGVDIMQEAVEIARLRLFLKLVAQVNDAQKIEPLPDIDFNIRAGNTLVGYATWEEIERAVTTRLGNGNEEGAVLGKIKEDATNLAAALKSFRAQQTALGGRVSPDDKRALRARMAALTHTLDRYLAWEYAVEADDPAQFAPWRASHQPFHWYAEFHEIMARGGFDVIIGNPPYVEYSKIKRQYLVLNLKTLSTANLYSMCTERAFALLSRRGYVSLIVPLSMFCTPNMIPAEMIIKSMSQSVWISYFSNRPDQLFEGSQNFLTIFIAINDTSSYNSIMMYTTCLLRWAADSRNTLFQTINYAYVTSPENHPIYAYPKFSYNFENSIANKIFSKKQRLSQWCVPCEKMVPRSIIYCYGGIYWTKARDFDSPIVKDGVESISTADRPVLVKDERINPVIISLILNSSLHYWFWLNYSDCRNKTYNVMLDIPISLEDLLENKEFVNFGDLLMSDYKRHKQRKIRKGRKGITEYDEFYPRLSKPIIDEIDRVLARHYGFTEEELDFIINYDIKYRMGKEADEGDAEG